MPKSGRNRGSTLLWKKPSRISIFARYADGYTMSRQSSKEGYRKRMNRRKPLTPLPVASVHILG